MHVGLGPGHIVLDGTQLPLPKGVQPPIFGPYLLQPNGCIKISLDMELVLGPGDFVLDGDPAPLHQKGPSPSPIFGHFYCSKTDGCTN